MSIIPPNVELVGDIGSFALFRWGIDVWTLYIRQTGALELHRGGAGDTAFLGLDVPIPKRQVTACILGDTLIIAWVEPTTSTIYLSRVDMGLKKYLLEPTPLWSGKSPALAVFKTTKIVMSYVDENDQHVYNVSLDLGATWGTPEIVDTAAVSEVGIDVYPSTDHRVFWAETAP